MEICDAPVFYATTEGQTERIARRIAAELRSAGLTSEAIRIGSDEVHQVDWDRVRGVIVGASIHGGRHQRDAADFVRAHRNRLNDLPSWFYSVSLSIASKIPSEAEAARKLAREFVAHTQWDPRDVMCLAGRLAYTQYNWLIRTIMRRIARKEGESTDTSRDHEYTDWALVDAFARQCSVDIHAASSARRRVPPDLKTPEAQQDLTRSS